MEKKAYIKEIRCRNGVVERTKYFVRSSAAEGTVRAKREARKGAARADNAERQLARLLNNNFDAGKDIHVVLEYTERQIKQIAEKAEAGTGARTDDTRAKRDRMFCAAQRDLANFIRRCRRECAKEGTDLKYVGATSDMDGETGKKARLHHHFICNAEAAEAVRKKWRGTAWIGELYNVNGDLSALASYIIAQVRPVEGTQRYVPSRNLEQPETSEPLPLIGNAALHMDSEMRVPKGAVLLYRSTYARGATQYIRFLEPGRREKTA